MNHNAIFIDRCGAGEAIIVKFNEQVYNQFTSRRDTEFVKFKQAYADGKFGIIPSPGYSAGVGIPLAEYPSKGDGPESLYSFAAKNRTMDSGLLRLAIDPTFIENLFLGTKNATQHTEKYNIESYIVHDSAGRTDYVLMYNKSTGKVGISRLGVFYGLRLRVTELDEARFREMVKNYGGAVEAEHKALLSIADGGYTSYKDDQDESVGEISTTIGNKLPNSRMLVSLRSTKNTGTVLYAGDYYKYFHIDREIFINNEYYEYIKNTPYMYTPDDFGDTVGLFKDAFYMFTDGEIDWNVLTELLKKLPEDVRIQVPVPTTGGNFWKVETVGLVNGSLERI